MITRDQPTIFDDALTVAVSAVEDGNMRFGRGDDNESRFNRIEFLQSNDIEPTQTTLLNVTYDTTDFCRYQIIDEEHQGEGMHEPVSSLQADALVVTRPDHAIFLPLADCVGVVIYDSKNQIMMVSHLGRHSIEQEGATKSIQYLIENFETDPADLRIWLSPAAGGDNYPLHARGNRSMHQVVVGEFLALGVPFMYIEVSEADTTMTDDYFSHSEFKAGYRDFDGRFAIVAMMRD